MPVQNLVTPGVIVATSAAAPMVNAVATALSVIFLVAAAIAATNRVAVVAVVASVRKDPLTPAAAVAVAVSAAAAVQAAPAPAARAEIKYYCIMPE